MLALHYFNEAYILYCYECHVWHERVKIKSMTTYNIYTKDGVDVLRSKWGNSSKMESGSGAGVYLVDPLIALSILFWGYIPQFTKRNRNITEK